MRLSRLISALCIGLFGVSALANEKSGDDYWREVGMGLAFVEQQRILEDQKCSWSVASLTGCLRALNTLAAKSKKPIWVGPKSLAREENVARTLKTFGVDFVAVELKTKSPASQTLRAYYERLARDRREEKAVLEAILGNQRSTPIEEMYLFVKSQVQVDLQKNGGEPSVAAAMFTANFVGSEDAHARLEVISQLQKRWANADDELVGIGVDMIQNSKGEIVVTHLREDGPAKTGNIMPGDILVAIDGAPLKGLKFETAIDKLVGVEDSVVRVLISRAGTEYLVQMTRKPIVRANVKAKIIPITTATRVGYVRLSGFNDSNACSKISSEIARMQGEGVSGLILDLRGNYGGLVVQAVCIGGLFVGKTVIARERDIKSGEEKTYYGDSDPVTALPLVVLIDAASASSSEIVAGALQDYGRAWILGERSYGKATVQYASVFHQGIYKYYTKARFHQPYGRTNQIHGIIPDVEVSMKPNMTLDERFSAREGDIYPNALEAIGEPWVQTRPLEVANLKECMARTGQAERLYEAYLKTQIPLEYQVLKAQDALSCLIK